MSKMNEEVNVNNEEVVVEAEGVEVCCEAVEEQKSKVQKLIDFGKKHKKLVIGAGATVLTIAAYATIKHFCGSDDIVDIVDVKVLEDVTEDVAEVVENQIAE